MSVILPKIFIFGAGSVARYVFPLVQNKYQILGFVDNDTAKQGQSFEGYTIYAPQVLLDSNFEMVVIASNAGVNTIVAQLLSFGIDKNKICTAYVDFTVKSRIVFLERLGQLFKEKGIRGSMAECGVFLGEFAREINRVFPNNKLYLFDTFSGFDARDVDVEQKERYSVFGEGHFNITNEDTVLNKMPHPEMCIIRKGYFPETTTTLDEAFCFVNLDFDLYNPTLAGLNYFASKMVKGGVLLIHDYFSGAFKGVKSAVDEFNENKGYPVLPIGDGLSVMIPF
jgi:hypothetical protein